MVLIEAMAAGLPIVSTNAPGCRDVIVDGFNGILAEPANSKDLADKTLQVLHSPTLKNNFIKNAKKSVKKYDWKNVSNKYVELYQNCLYERKNI